MKYQPRLSYKHRNAFNKLWESFIRDRWGNLTNCQSNRTTKRNILKLEREIKRRK